MSTNEPVPGPPSAIAARSPSANRTRLGGGLIAAIGVVELLSASDAAMRHITRSPSMLLLLLVPAATIAAGAMAMRGGRVGVGLGLLACGNVIVSGFEAVTRHTMSLSYPSAYLTTTALSAITLIAGVIAAVLLLRPPADEPPTRQVGPTNGPVR